AAIGVSVDGPAEIHDRLRASPGSHAAALEALHNARDAGFITTSNSQINQLNRLHLEETAAALRDAGVRVWRAQLTAPMGRAADRPDWILQPWMILQVIDTLAKIKIEAAERARQEGVPLERAFTVALGNNVGYFGPHEQLLRSRPGHPERYWEGCQAGTYVMGIESDGTVKGCPSLPTAPYVGGNVRDLSLETLWAEAEPIGFTRHRSLDELWGFCKTCYYAEICRGGCSFTAHSTLGRRGNNPFCWHRANELRKRGRREVLRHKVRAPGTPYDFGAFELDEEPWQDDETPARPIRALPIV